MVIDHFAGWKEKEVITSFKHFDSAEALLTCLDARDLNVCHCACVKSSTSSSWKRHITVPICYYLEHFDFDLFGNGGQIIDQIRRAGPTHGCEKPQIENVWQLLSFKVDTKRYGTSQLDTRQAGHVDLIVQYLSSKFWELFISFRYFA